MPNPTHPTFTTTLAGQSVAGHCSAAAGSTAGGVLLLHGAGHDHQVWRTVQHALTERGVTSLAIDLPGHGQSGGPLPASIEAYADWCAALIASLASGPALVAGPYLALLGTAALPS